MLLNLRLKKEKELVFDAVNENLPEIVENFGSDTRKIFANEYIDDRNIWPLDHDFYRKKEELAESETKSPDFHEKSSMEKSWAEREVEIACKHETPDRKPGEWDYGCFCYESALKALKSLYEDGHSIFSIRINNFRCLMSAMLIFPSDSKYINLIRCFHYIMIDTFIIPRVK